MVQCFELPKGDYAFPLTITQKVLHTRYLDLPRNEELFRFDAGSNPQPGDVIEINQTVKLGDYEATILNAYVDDRYGQAWRFNIDGGEDIFDLKLTLLDYEAFLGMSGSTPPLQAPPIRLTVASPSAFCQPARFASGSYKAPPRSRLAPISCAAPSRPKPYTNLNPPSRILQQNPAFARRSRLTLHAFVCNVNPTSRQSGQASSPNIQVSSKFNSFLAPITTRDYRLKSQAFKSKSN